MTHFRAARAWLPALALFLTMAAALLIPPHGVPPLPASEGERPSSGFQFTSAAPPPALAGPAAPDNLALPIGFAHDVIAANLAQPTGFAFLPDGRILVAEKRGVVRVIKDGALLPAPFLDLRDRVNDDADRGLMSIAPDADFGRNGYVYLLYTYENDARDYSGPKTARLTRVTAAGDAAPIASETVVLGTTVGRSCNDYPAAADCLSSDGPSHTVGTIRVAADGALFVSIGESGSFTFVDGNSLRAQDLDRLAGKILRISPNGGGLPGNPFWNGDPAANRSKVWAYGLRNPFRFGLHPSTGLPYVGDPGWATWEEINVASPGANFGWPCYEGPERQRGFQAMPLCQALYAKGPEAVRPPLLYYPYYGRSAAVIGGAFVNGGPFPAEYQGAFLYADYAQGFIRMLRLDGGGNLVGAPRTFAFVSTPVDLQMGPDGALYYITIYGGPTGGRLGRVRYAAEPGCTTWQYHAEYFSNATLSGAPALRQCDDFINYNWRLGKPGEEVGTDGFSVRWTGRFGFRAANYTFVAQADEGVRVWVDGEALLDAWPAVPSVEYRVSRAMAAGEHEVKVEYYEGTGRAQVRVNWTADSGDPQPRAVITSPPASLKFKVGDTVAFAGQGQDAQGQPLPAGALAWQVLLHHCREGDCHSHPFAAGSGTAGRFTVTDHDDNTAFEIRLTASTGAGQTAAASVVIHPQTVRLTIATAPPGLQVIYGGAAAMAPLTVLAAVGGSRTIVAPTPQGDQEFVAWSDGGAAQHEIRVAASATRTATFIARTGGPATAQPVPALESPPPGAALPALEATLAWRLPPNAAQMHLQVVPAGNDGPGVNLIRGAAAGFAVPSPPSWYVLLPGMTYRWRVRFTEQQAFAPEDSPAWGPWSESRAFRTPAPSPVGLHPAAPADGAALAGAGPVTLQWAHPDLALFYWEVQVSGDDRFDPDPATASSFVWWNLVHGGVTAPAHSWRTPPLEPGATYYWRVRPRVQGDGVPADWSGTWSFRTP